MEGKEKCYPASMVAEALRIATLGSAGVLNKKDAEESLKTMPEELQNAVMTFTVLAHHKVQAKVEEAMMKSVLEEFLH